MTDTTWTRYKGYLITYARGGGARYPKWRVVKDERILASTFTKGEAKRWIDANARTGNPLRATGKRRPARRR